MNKTCKRNQIIAALLAVLVVFGTVIPVNAASADVNIEVKATTMEGVSLVIPSEVPIVFNEDGTNTVPTNWIMENRSEIASIYLAEIHMDSDTGWTLLAGDFDPKQIPADSKRIIFSVGVEENFPLMEPDDGDECASGGAQFAKGEVTIPAGESKQLIFGVERGAYTETIASSKAFTMQLDFAFN